MTRNRKMEEVKVLRTWSSPYGLRIVWALKLKGVEFETMLEELLNKSMLLLESNPIHKRIPVLIHNGKPVCESLVILEYIDDTWKECPLLPQDPYQKSVARFWAKFNDDKLLPSIWRVFLSEGKRQEELIVEALKNLEFMEEELSGKKFLGGDKIGYLDLVIGWMADLWSILEEITDLKLINEEKFPSLTSWIETFSNVQVVKESRAPRDQLVTKFQVLRHTHLRSAQPQ